MHNAGGYGGGGGGEFLFIYLLYILHWSIPNFQSISALDRVNPFFGYSQSIICFHRGTEEAIISQLLILVKFYWIGTWKWSNIIRCNLPTISSSPFLLRSMLDVIFLTHKLFNYWSYRWLRWRRWEITSSFELFRVFKTWIYLCIDFRYCIFLQNIKSVGNYRSDLFGIKTKSEFNFF